MAKHEHEFGAASAQIDGERLSWEQCRVCGDENPDAPKPDGAPAKVKKPPKEGSA